MYIKIYSKSSKNYNIDNVTSLLLTKKQKIMNIQIIDKNRILFTISDGEEVQGIIFDTDNCVFLTTMDCPCTSSSLYHPTDWML